MNKVTPRAMPIFHENRMANNIGIAETPLLSQQETYDA
jgi:hypothetical protein